MHVSGTIGVGTTERRSSCPARMLVVYFACADLVGLHDSRHCARIKEKGWYRGNHPVPCGKRFGDQSRRAGCLACPRKRCCHFGQGRPHKRVVYGASDGCGLVVLPGCGQATGDPGQGLRLHVRVADRAGDGCRLLTLPRCGQNAGDLGQGLGLPAGSVMERAMAVAWSRCPAAARLTATWTRAWAAYAGS